MERHKAERTLEINLNRLDCLFQTVKGKGSLWEKGVPVEGGEDGCDSFWW